MDKKRLKIRRKSIIAEYLKGTRIALITGFFGITKGGLYYILDKENIPKRKKHLTRLK